MLLEAVSFYCKIFAHLSCDHSGLFPKRGGQHSPSVGVALPVLMRCRSMNLPILRIFQKLYRVHRRDPVGDQQYGFSAVSGEMHDIFSAIRLAECGEGEVLHLYLGPQLVQYISVKLSDRVSIVGNRPNLSRFSRFPEGSCVLKFEKGLLEAPPTPFDAFIERHRERWLAENAPFRKHTCKSDSFCEGEEVDVECQEAQRPLPLPVGLPFVGEARVKDSAPSPLSFANFSTSSISQSGALMSGAEISECCSAPVSVGSDVGIPTCLNDSLRGWETSRTPLEALVSICGTHFHKHSDSFAEDASSRLAHRLLPVKAEEVPRGHATVAHPCRIPPPMGSGGATRLAFLQAGTPVQVNNGDGQWICGYWLEELRQLAPHWFDPSLSENALLEHFGPICIRDLLGEGRLITPTSNGKVYVAVAPHVRVLSRSSLHLQGESVEVRSLFESVAATGSFHPQNSLLHENSSSHSLCLKADVA
jgi:hypothetical protein